ncbi:hypothetical protein LZ554_005378 [Drepanopeziza brunnea f. sp. 'monogermtubi']|nr:hypothetical protein LZ554_005378 [Drepanopeziza brunnea f. sp. 'monogermtubi']
MAHNQIQILSDLHLEAPKGYDVFEVVPKAPYLALIGDIGCVTDPGYFTFIEKQISQFRVVFIMLGNHEPYHSSWATARERLKGLGQHVKGKAGLGSLIFLDQTRYDVSAEITILGCTLFSNILPAQSDHVSYGLNDFYHIEDWTVEKHNEAHLADLAWLNNQVETIARTEPQRKIIILTHHSPTTDPRSVTDPC